jgi:hypothetical protein
MDVESLSVSAFDDWYDREHIPERQAVAGVGEVCRWSSIAGMLPGHLVTYELTSSDVLDSSAYQALKRAGDSQRTRRMKQHMTWLERHELDLTDERLRGPGPRPAGRRRWAVIALGADEPDGRLRTAIDDAAPGALGVVPRSRYFRARHGSARLEIHDFIDATEAADVFAAITRLRDSQDAASLRIGLCRLVAHHVARSL